MRSELAEHVGAYLDAVAPPITLDEVRQAGTVVVDDDLDRELEVGGSPGRGASGRSASRRWVAIAAVAASAVLVVAGAVSLRRTDESSTVDVGADPATSSTAVDGSDVAWLTPFGPESAAPSVPAGRTVMDFEDLRFAVPGDWVVPITRSCIGLIGTAVPGAVLLPDPATTGGCQPEVALPESVLRIDVALQTSNGARTKVGTLDATDIPVKCFGCPPTYLLDDGHQISVTGPGAGAVLATFTDSGARRALQDGPVADRDGWNPVEYGGVGLEVPREWTFLDLPGSFSQTTEANGGTRTSGMPAPGSCGWAMFGADGQMTVGEEQLHMLCPAPMRIDLAPGNGAWIRPIADDQIDRLGTAITRGEVGGLDVTILDVSPHQRRTPAPAIDAIIRTPTGALWLTVGTGTDASVVRSILRSLHAT